MSPYLRHISFWFPALLFLIHQVLQHLLVLNLLWLDDYLDPFCFTAIFLVVYQWQRDRWLGRKERMLRIEILAWVIVLILVSEWLFPQLNRSLHSDPYDVIPLVLGGVWHTVSRPKNKAYLV